MSVGTSLSLISVKFSFSRDHLPLSTPPLELVKAFPSVCFHRDTKGYEGQGKVRDLSRKNVNERVAKFVLQLLEYTLV